MLTEYVRCTTHLLISYQLPKNTIVLPCFRATPLETCTMKFFCSLFLVAALAAPALAQTNKNELFVAFSDSAHPGCLASYARSLAEHVASEGDLSGHYRSNPKDHRYHLDVGLRVMFRTSEAKAAAY